MKEKQCGEKQRIIRNNKSKQGRGDGWRLKMVWYPSLRPKDRCPAELSLLVKHGPGSQSLFSLCLFLFFCFTLDVQGSHQAAMGRTCQYTIPAFRRGTTLFPAQGKGVPGFLPSLAFPDAHVCISEFPFGPPHLRLNPAHRVLVHIWSSLFQCPSRYLALLFSVMMQ